MKVMSNIINNLNANFQDGGIIFLWALCIQYCLTHLFFLKYGIVPCIHITNKWR